MIQQMKRFHSTIHIDTLPVVHLTRTTWTTSVIPLITQLFNLWQECLTTNLTDRLSKILSYEIHQQYTTHTIFQLYVESSLTISVPRELVEVLHENFIVQPSWLFRRQYQLTLKHMFLYMQYLFRFIFSLSHALYASLKSQIFRDKLVVRILEKGIMLHFVLFIPIVSLVTLQVTCFFVIYITNYLADVLYAML